MAVSGSISVPSAVGSSTVLTVSGAATLGFAQLIQAYLDSALTAKTLNIVQGTQTALNHTVFASPLSTGVNEAVVSANEDGGVGIGTTATLQPGFQALFDNVNGASTVIGATGPGNLEGIFGGVGSSATFEDQGGNNLLVFVNGNNTYLGDTIQSGAFDTVVGGSGFDTITTGIGKTDVLAGTGHAIINMEDTVTPTANSFNDIAYLGDGEATVNMSGLKDAVLAISPGQIINGGLAANDVDGVALLPNASGIGGDLVTANAAAIAVFDYTTNNTIIGGSGGLYFVGGAGTAASITGGTGETYIFGAAGELVTFGSTVAGYQTDFIAGAGNETLNGAGATGGIAFFASNPTSSVASAQVSDSLIGGAGADTFVSGAGNETLVGGGGANLFVIDATTDGVGGNITLSDFAASSGNLIAFANFTSAEIDAALAGAHTVAGASGGVNTVFTLSDHTTVTVVGISSLAGHTFGG